MRKNNVKTFRANHSLLSVAVAALMLQAGTAQATQAEGADSTATDANYVAGEIIVTAQRRSESLQKVPVAMTALNAEALTNQGVTNISNLSTAAPSLKVVAYPNSSDTLTLTMRGQGAGDVGQLTRDGGVAVYIDGFYMARPQGALLDLGDPERIEILRGPQGTLYGRNTTGGAVNVITSKPSDELGGYGTLSIGSRNLVRSTASINVPLSDTLAVKGNIVYLNQDGFVKNEGRTHDFGEFGQIAGRVAVQWKPSEDFTARYAFNRGRVNSTPLYYVTPALEGITEGPLVGYDASPYTTTEPLDLQSSVSHFVDHQLTLEYDLSDSFQLRSLTAYRGFKGFQNMNYGYAMSLPDMPMFIQQLHNYRTRQYSQELQLTGDISERLTFTGGLYWYKETGTHVVRTLIDGEAPFEGVMYPYSLDQGYVADSTSKSIAAYAQSTWTPGLLEDRLKLTVGGRYTKDKRNAERQRMLMQLPDPDEQLQSNNQKFDNFSPMANLAVEWTNQFMTYVKYSQAYKAGGSGESSPDFSMTFGPEKVTAWEAGFKAQAFDRKLTLNAAAFLNKFDDMQIDFIADPYDTSVVATANAGKATIKGVEIDLTFRPVEDFSINASFSHLDQNIKRISVLEGSIFEDALIPGSDTETYAVGDNIANHFQLPFVPKYSYSIGADWTVVRAGRHSVSAHANYSYQSAVYATSGVGPGPGRDFPRSDRSKNLNARINWNIEDFSGADLQFAIFADNLLNDKRSDFAIGLGGTPVVGYQLGTYNYNEPRTIGGELRITF